MSDTQEVKLNDAVTTALEDILEVKGGCVSWKPMPNPVTHGQFNRRMFLEAFIAKAGMGVSIEADDIMEYGGLTEREFPIILKEYMDKGVVVKAENPFGAELYRLNLTTD